jgi:hypothetical protein
MLPDPRRYAAQVSHPLADHTGANGSAEYRTETFRELAAAGRDREIRAILAAAPCADAYARLWRSLCAAIEKPARDEVSARVFAMPWIIVCGGTAPAQIECVLRDPAALARVFEEHGVFGASRNVGMSHALCALDALESLDPSEVLRGWESAQVRDVPPTPITLRRGVEEVHLRFLLGAAVAPSHAPDIVETGANIGAWGTPALRAMGGQLATAGAQVLAMPRPPAGLYSAAYAGRRAAVEAAFNLFMSNTLRRFRLEVGDPRVTVSAHESGELRVTLWTPLDEALTEGFRWPLHAADDLGEIETAIRDMICECRLQEPHVPPDVLPDRSAAGAVLFPAGVE